MLTSNGKRAVVRRVLLVAGILGGITLALWQQGGLYRVEVVDFADRQRTEPGWTGHREQPLQDYVAYKTEGRLLRKAGEAWSALYKDIASARPDHFFAPGRTPLNELAGAFEGAFTYVALEHEGQTRYLGVTAWRPGDFPSPPPWLRYPFGRLASLAFFAGLLSYVLIPWPRRLPHVVAYARLTSAFLPDLFIGMLLLGMFYAIPWFVVPNQAHVSHPFVVEGGWIVLTAVMWGFCLFGLAIYAVAAWYETLRIEVAGDHMTVETMRAVERIDFGDIERVDLVIREPPKTLVRVGLLVSLLNWRALAPTLLVAGREDRVAEFVLRDGRRKRFGLMGMRHRDCLVSSLKQAGVTVDPDLES